MEEKSCLNCGHFHWWDGDFCCLHPDKDWKILFPSKDGTLPEDFDKKFVIPCELWEKCKYNIYGF